MTQPTDIFPFRSTLSLRGLFDFWQDVGHDEASPRAAVARQIGEHLKQTPALAEPISDPAFLDAHRDLLDLMMVAIFPAALWEKVIMAVMPPFDMRPFYTTPAYDRLRLFEEGCPQEVAARDMVELERIRTMHAYYWILAECYETSIKVESPFVLRVTNPETGLPQYFKIDFNPRFTSVTHDGPLPALSESQIQLLLAEPRNLALWQELLPPDGFQFQGFVVITATEVTNQSVLSALKDDLLRPDAMATADKVAHLQNRIRALLKQPDLELGLICLKNQDIEGIRKAKALGRSLLLGEMGAPECPHKAESFYAHVYERDEPLVVSDLSECDVCTGFEYRLKEDGFRTLLLAPLRSEGRLIGIMEIASPRPHRVNPFMAAQLTEAIALFATAMKRSLDEQEDRVQAFIKENYTAIHPAVEWRFREAAQRYLDEQAIGGRPFLERIAFENVYPLYALTDIRHSSDHRNEAIREDLKKQLGLAQDVIVEAGIARPMPLLKEISHRIAAYLDLLDDSAGSEDETSVLDFLREDVESIFDQLAGFGDGVRKRIVAYQDALDANHRLVYEARRAFDQSVETINDVLSAYLLRQEERAQSYFPHYFELFKTDGIDYSVYIGPSLAEDGAFHEFYLRNMRLWQLLVTCGLEWELRQLQPHLPKPLEATHLVLVQATPLSIHFRLEEKRFDVEGAYNIRYEIIKKRIDKARVRGTGERLTQPGQIAIVYAQPREAAEYERYLEYMRSKGYLEGEIEELDLEPMQGVHGLRALRVTISEEPPDAAEHIEPLGIEEAATLVRVS